MTNPTLAQATTARATLKRKAAEMPVHTRADIADATTHDDHAIAMQAEPAGIAEPAEDQSHSGSTPQPPLPRPHRRRWQTVLAYGLLPALVTVLAAAGGYLKFADSSERESQSARVQSVQAATEITVALLSYRPDSVEKDLNAARDRLTGNFHDAYTSLINDVVIPGAKQKHITSVATVPAASSVSAAASHAVVLLFVDQTITFGTDPASNTASTVRVTLEKLNGRWLISQFEPV